MGDRVSTPAKKARDRDLLERLARAGRAAARAELLARARAERRDVLLLEVRATVDPTPSLRDVAELGKVSHAWVRKLERREEGSS
jgi:hypothetical protein